jgi:uncharacterized membrane protein YdbT with pleckstrin-like domain
MISLNRLPNQQRNEKTVLFLRRHWIEIFFMFGYLAALGGMPIIIFFLLSATGVSILSGPLAPLAAIFISVYALIVLIIMMTQFTDYYLDTWIVTNERVINIEQHALFSRIVSELHLNQVQDVTAETHGFLPTIFTYGDVYIQTAGTRERFNFKTVDNPEMVKQVITKLVNEDKRRHGDASQ